MKFAQKITTVDMLMKADPYGDFTGFQDRLPPLLRLQAHLFGQSSPTDDDNAADTSKLREIFGDTQPRFDRRKSDRRQDPSRILQNSRVSSDRRRKSDGSVEIKSDTPT
ncbi:hypothetical protein H8L32_05130 [Undibacterium sp. CY18W]|uniref:Uncharacterized protein n=1 Tax=Undibacterium hunanense TaxID=2762292 RepID=A0ABR6ZLU2_9BURK|nr:hypothetical protein [Undibacterium hunanense]MBC3916851.1 hypothetical protein [Undibacterium hunanense]